MSDLAEAKLTLRGAAILRSYRHPEDWRDGDDTDKPRLWRCKILRVEALRIGNSPSGFPANDPRTARLNAQAIRAFGRAVCLRPDQLLIDQRVGNTPYVYVREVGWPVALPLLRALHR